MFTKGTPVEIKGQKEGLWIYLDDQTPQPKLFSLLDQKLAASNNFFSGAEVIIHTGTRTLSPDDLDQLHHIIEKKHTLHIKTIHQTEPSAQNTSESSDITDVADLARKQEIDPDDEFMKFLDETFRIPVKQKWHEEQTFSSDYLYENQEQTFYFRGTVRSGQVLEFSGNIVILGDVNPGAYVVASGDIIVLGRLNGVVHAGAEGEERSVIISPGFFPSQLRIAQYIGRPPDEHPQSTPVRARTEKAFIKDGVIVIEPIL